MQIDLLPGDIFCSSWSSLLGKSIKAVQKFYAVDGEAFYSHAGIITDSTGGTLESLWTIKRSHLSHYNGVPILIGRHIDMTPQLAEIGLKIVSRHIGAKYPVHRLFLHFVKPLVKHMSTGHYLVCSELVSSFLYICNLQKYWKGVNPDDVADMIRHSNQYEVVFEEILSKQLIDEH